MKKIITLIIASAFCAINYSTPANAGEFNSRTSIKMCIYSEKLEGITDWEIYYTQDIPRNQSCSYPPKPAVLGGNSFAYDYSIGNIDYYFGMTSDGEKCILKRRSILVAD